MINKTFKSILEPTCVECGRPVETTEPLFMVTGARNYCPIILICPKCKEKRPKLAFEYGPNEEGIMN